MDNKNIIFNHTIEQYNKKYRVRRQHLLKYTKKEVEEFDKKTNTEIKNFLLLNRKWWFIDGTYYEIPRAPRYTWFRNLNGGIQAATCLLGTGVVATAVTVPLVLLNQNKVVEPTITISGADYDKSASHIELHKESTIVLKQKGTEEITDIEYVKVGDKQLANNQYTFDKPTKKVTIKAEAMTSTKIEIKVKVEEVTTKVQWVAKANSLHESFNNSTKKYLIDQISDVLIFGESGDAEIKYSGTVGTDRQFDIYYNDEYPITFAGPHVSGDGFAKYISSETEGGHFKINDDGSIEYTTDNVPTGKKLWYKTIKMNKYGYLTYFEQYSNGTSDGVCKVTYSGEPKDIVTKDDWFVVADKWYNEFNEVQTEYAPSQVEMLVDGQPVEFSSLEYIYDENGNRIARLGYDGEQFDLASPFNTSAGDLPTFLKEVGNGVTYTIKDDEIIYKDENASIDDYTQYCINKYGYLTKLDIKTDPTTIKTCEFKYSGTQSLYYNIDWNDGTYDLGDGEKTLYEYAQSATKVEFIKDSATTGGVCVGDTNAKSSEQDPVYASFETKGEEKIFKIWSAEKIRIDYNDVSSYGLFESCSGITSFNFSNIDTSKVTYFNNFFEGCSNVKNLNLSSFDTSSAKEMSSMFKDCTELVSLDLSSFDTSKVYDMFNMFYRSGNLTTIYASEKFVTTSVGETESTDMFYDCLNLKGGEGTPYNESHTNKEYARIDQGPDSSAPGYFTDIEHKPYEIDWQTTKFFNDKTLYKLCMTNKNSGEEYHGANEVHFVQSDDETIHPGEMCVGENPDVDKIYASWDESNYILNVRAKNKIAFSDNDVFSGSYTGLFNDFMNATTIELANIDTSKVTNMDYMFSSCYSVRNLDVSMLDTSNVTTMEGMFYVYNYEVGIEPKLENIIGLDHFNTSNVINMIDMFACSTCKEIDVSSFNTSKVTEMTCMFSDCKNLERIYASDKFSKESLEDSDLMFDGSDKLIGGNGTEYDGDHTDAEYAIIDGEGGNPGYFSSKEATLDKLTFEVTSESDMTCKVNATNDEIDGAVVIPEKATINDNVYTVTEICDEGFYSCDDIKTVYLPETISKIGNDVFSACDNLKYINMPSSITEVGAGVFNSCPSLVSIDLSKTQIQEIKGISPSTGGGFFNGCEKLKYVILPSSLTKIGAKCFYGCETLDSISFLGTIDDWNSIIKGDDWHKECPATVIHCINGDTQIDA